MKEHKYNNTVIQSKGGEDTNPQDLIGRKVRGFKFESTDCISYASNMDRVIGKEGKIILLYDEGHCAVLFENTVWHYPTSLIHEHLVDEDTSEQNVKQDWYCPKCKSYVSGESVTYEETHDVCNTGVVVDNDTSPKIIDLSNVEGVEMMVGDWSDNWRDNWRVKKVVAKISDKFIDNDGYYWKFAKPIEVKKVTMKKIEEMFGCKVEIVKED